MDKNIWDIWALIGAIVFLVEAVLDAVGVQCLYKKQYRGLPILREWQTKRAYAEIMMGIGGLIVCFSSEGTWYFLSGSVVFLAALIALNVIGTIYKKKLPEE